MAILSINCQRCRKLVVAAVPATGGGTAPGEGGDTPLDRIELRDLTTEEVQHKIYDQEIGGGKTPNDCMYICMMT